MCACVHVKANNEERLTPIQIVSECDHVLVCPSVVGQRCMFTSCQYLVQDYALARCILEDIVCCIDFLSVRHYSSINSQGMLVLCNCRKHIFW